MKSKTKDFIPFSNLMFRAVVIKKDDEKSAKLI